MCIHNICFHGWIRRVSNLECLLSRDMQAQQMPSELEIDQSDDSVLICN